MLVFLTMCRELKLSKASLASSSLLGGGSYERQESRAGVNEESQVARRFLVLAQVESLIIVRLLHVTGSSDELPQKEPLGEACANPFRRANRKLSDTSYDHD